MFFSLTDEQRALQATVREFLADRFPLSSVRALYDDPDGDGDPAELWKAVGEQGWLAVTIDEQYDGLGLGLLDAAVLARCWGEGCAPGPFLPTLVAAEAIRLGASPEQKKEWLPRIAGGEVKLSLAATGRVNATNGTLSGAAQFVEYAHVADRIVVAADGGTLWLVDPASGGVTVSRHDALDRSTRFATVTFDKARGDKLPDHVLPDVVDRAAVLYANDLAGIARVALSRTVDYDKTREQFGKPVGSFQALKHALADLHVATTMAEHSGWYAAHALDARLPDAALAVSVAKSKCSDTARDVTAAMIQFHGGIGYTWEHDAHLFFKRAKREEYQYGDGTFHRERIARLAVDANRS
ncbi:MAG TPA: acyl-CoA dehydrogenase family protein [Mycobacteriales bacterium]|nr:acyl-CoA dehydrogenase family protein [Mycobacteriales bacterium]